MVQRGLGLTSLYNLVNDPSHDDEDVSLLRELHMEVDEAVIAAFGWEDIRLRHGFNELRKIFRWSPSAGSRVEILDRLLQENQQRAQAL